MLSMLSSRDLRLFHQAQMLGGFVRRGGARAASVIRSCALPNDEQKKRKASIRTSQVFNITGGVHIHIGDGRGQDAVAISPEAKALLQNHAVKATTTGQMHDDLGFEDVGNLQHLASDIVAQLKLKPLLLEMVLHMLRDHQKQQDDVRIVGTQGQQQQQQQQDGSKQPEDVSWTQVAGQTGITPLPHALSAADASSRSAASPVADDSPVPTSAGAAAEGEMLPATPAARGGPDAEPGTDCHTQPGGGLSMHSRVAIIQAMPVSPAVNGIAITPDGRRAVTAGPEDELHVWDLEARSCIATLHGDRLTVGAVAITPDGRHAVSCSRSSWEAIHVWDLDTHAHTATMALRLFHNNQIMSVAVTPDGRHVLCGDGRMLCKWPLRVAATSWVQCKRWELPDCERGDAITSIAVTPDGRLAVLGIGHGTLSVWDLRKNKQVGTLEGHVGTITAVAITPDGRRVVSAASADADALQVWDLATRTRIGSLEGHDGWVNCVAITPDGRRAVAGSEDGKLRVWDLATLACTGMTEGDGSGVRCVAITPDGRYAVAAASCDNSLLIWDLDPTFAHSKVPAASAP